ncbi:hypothetical protein PR048_007618 [Dryococelus australis]|uniref:Uncharacterized protein n=1 Tax=Dryococelus australis TaxID=614101 RepID=A0ABQ9HUU7_9NEOP|nr:hypothetical protein PR048_007618 [Dryococelus australis]
MQCILYLSVNRKNHPLLAVKTLLLSGAAVADWSACSPPTKANRVQSTAKSPDFRKWESCRTMPLVGWFSWGSPKCCNQQTVMSTAIGSLHLAGTGYAPEIRTLARSSRLELLGATALSAFSVCALFKRKCSVARDDTSAEQTELRPWVRDAAI